MKISIRIILINFVVVVLIMGSSAIAFYSIMHNTLSSQKSKSLVNSANNFTYAYRNKLLNSEDEFRSLTAENVNNAFRLRILRTNDLDFIFEVDPQNQEHIIRYSHTADVVIPQKPFKLSKFYEFNPYIIVSKYTDISGRVFYYGLVLSVNLFNSANTAKLSAEIHAA